MLHFLQHLKIFRLRRYNQLIVIIDISQDTAVSNIDTESLGYCFGKSHESGSQRHFAALVYRIKSNFDKF